MKLQITWRRVARSIRATRFPSRFQLALPPLCTSAENILAYERPDF
jgi:hypothetical protein